MKDGAPPTVAVYVMGCGSGAVKLGTAADIAAAQKVAQVWNSQDVVVCHVRWAPDGELARRVQAEAVARAVRAGDGHRPGWLACGPDKALQWLEAAASALSIPLATDEERMAREERADARRLFGA